MINSFKLMICLLLFFSCVTLGFSSKQKTLPQIILVGSHATKNSVHGKWLDLIYTEVFRRLGYDFQYKAFPSARSIFMSSSGIVDGEINRVSSYQVDIYNMIKVKEHHFSTVISAYAVKPNIKLNGWNSLSNTKYNVDYRRGTKIVENQLKSILKSDQIHSVTTVEQGIQKLISNRTDLYIDGEFAIEQLKDQDNLAIDLSSVYKAGIMATETLHVYLHAKNANLAPKTEKILKQMKTEGLIEKLKLKAINNIIDDNNYIRPMFYIAS